MSSELAGEHVPTRSHRHTCTEVSSEDPEGWMLGCLLLFKHHVCYCWALKLRLLSLSHWWLIPIASQYPVKWFHLSAMDGLLPDAAPVLKNTWEGPPLFVIVLKVCCSLNDIPQFLPFRRAALILSSKSCRTQSVSNCHLFSWGVTVVTLYLQFQIPGECHVLGFSYSSSIPLPLFPLDWVMSALGMTFAAWSLFSWRHPWSGLCSGCCPLSFWQIYSFQSWHSFHKVSEVIYALRNVCINSVGFCYDV